MGTDRFPQHPLAAEAVLERRAFLTRALGVTAAVAGAGGLTALLDGCAATGTTAPD